MLVIPEQQYMAFILQNPFNAIVANESISDWFYHESRVQEQTAVMALCPIRAGLHVVQMLVPVNHDTLCPGTISRHRRAGGAVGPRFWSCCTSIFLKVSLEVSELSPAWPQYFHDESKTQHTKHS